MRKLTTFWMLIMLCMPLAMMGGNTKTTVTQVTDSVAVTDNVDYIISGDTPFTDDGKVNIVNTDHAVLIINKVKPSVAISKWLKKVLINGEQAKNSTNCQVKLYKNGCIILPYGNTFKPLTTFTERNFEGESCNNYGLGNTGGYMNTLTTALLNNRIRSFKLKRGYMVTFSTLSGGKGYSRCFIAADADLEISELPAVLDQKISSYRVFKWYDAAKKQIADNLNSTVLNALRVQSSYTWGVGENKAPDYECIPNHIYEDWPSSSAIGEATWSPHTKNNNEPRNSSDDHPQDLETILNNWENMMRTGMRLCSPASWDGSDYWNATGFLAEFMDSIDARGWRCDIIDLHCYWTEGNFGNIANWANKYKRPIWISEWCWGASWNNNGAFANGVTQAQVKNALQTICSGLNNANYVERYYYWNSERDISKVYKNGSLTPAGEYYSAMDAPMAYNGKYDFVPTTPPQYGPSKFTQKVVSTGKTRLTWHDSNGEYNQLMEVQMKDARGLWVVLDTIAQKESAANYSYDVDNDDEDVLYRLHLIDLNGKEYYTYDQLELGDAFEIDGQLFYAGGNLFPNGQFDLGFTDWTSGIGKPLAEPQFQIVGDGGFNGGSYLQSHLNGSAGHASSVKTAVELQEGQQYVFRIATRNGSNYIKFSLSADGKTATEEVAKAARSTDWSVNTFLFNSGTYSKGLLSCYSLAAKAQIDDVQLRQLFPTKEAAVADGVEKARLRAEAQKAYNTDYPSLNEDLTARMAAITGSDEATLEEAETILTEHQTAISKKNEAKELEITLKTVEQKPCPAYDEMKTLLNSADEALTAEGVITSVDQLQELMDKYLSFARASKQPRNPSFTNEKSDGWQVKVGTFKDGDQRTATKYGKTCWNAWWSTTKQDATMEINQTVTNLPEGYYRLECKATTEHFCISDQHAYLKNGSTVAVSPILSKGYFDLPVPNVWDTLTTAPIYVEAGGSLTVGFVGSKQGAQTGKWHSFGNATATSDNREGWWCATDFILSYHAIDSEDGISTIEHSSLKSEESDAVYDLSGRKVGNSKLSTLNSQLKKGIYIKVEDGRAVLIAH